MSRLLNCAIVAASLAATPAMAADFTALGSFNGTNGNGGFSYGSTNGATLTAFTSSTGCVLNSPVCLNTSATTNIPQASFGGSYSTVSIPSDALVLHPGNSAASAVYSAFTSLLGGTYAYTIDLASVGKDTTDGVSYQLFTSINNIVTLVGTSGVLAAYTDAKTLTGTQVLTANESFGVIIGDRTVYYGDSTALNFGVTAVPEPASWAMMLAGFGMVGFAARRRAKPSVRVTYA